MLRTKERTQSRGVNFVVRTVAVSGVVLLAVVTTALRGLAEPVDGQPTTQTTPSESVRNTMDEMFKYPPIDPAIIGDNDSGIFVLRVGELLKRDSIKPMVSGINQALSATCKSWFGMPELAEFDLEMVEFVVGDAQVKVKRLEPDPEREHNSQLMFGSGYWIVRFNRDISSWKQWIRKNAPTAEELQHGEITYFQFPVIPALGPEGFRVAARDSHTLVFAHKEDAFWEQVEATNLTTARWTDDWAKLDGGLFTVLSTDKSLEASVEEAGSPEGKLLDQVADNIQQVGWSVDLNDRTEKMGVKMHFSCSGFEKAELIQSGINELTALVENEIEEERGWVSADAELILASYSELIDNIKLQATAQKNGTAVVSIESYFGFPLAELGRAVFPGNIEVVNLESKSSTTK